MTSEVCLELLTCFSSVRPKQPCTEHFQALLLTAPLLSLTVTAPPLSCGVLQL